jgi:hypothetical protein
VVPCDGAHGAQKAVGIIKHLVDGPVSASDHLEGLSRYMNNTS